MKNHKSQIINAKWLFAAILTLLLTSCEDLIKKYLDTTDMDILSSYVEPAKSDMEVTNVTFSPDYKTFTVSTRMLHSGPGIPLTDTTLVRTEVLETIDGLRHTVHSTPRLIQMRNVEGEGVEHNDLRMLVLIDRTLTVEQLEQIQRYIYEMKTVFGQNRLFLVFMDGDNISKEIPATDYIIESYLKHVDKPYIHLYRAMQENRMKMVNRESVWKGAKRCVMITFAAERPYDDNSDIPYDTEHYRYKEQLVNRSAKDTTFLAYYVDMDAQDTDENDDVKSVPYIFCNLNGGEYFWEYDWIAMKRGIYEAFHFDFPDNCFTFVNPDHKVYRGDRKELTFNIYERKTDKVIASFTTAVSLGRLYKPIIVNGHSLPYVIIQGILLGIFIFLLVFFVMQVVIPVVRYIIFRHKYLLTYAGPNMSVNNQAVAESCYLCKAPFQPGDRIVVKCEHTMHESCWEDNDYHCPEYSDRCKHGSHYFNKYNLFDVQNASFYMRWVLAAIMTSTLAWLGLTLYVQLDMDNILPQFMTMSKGQVPFIGFIMSSCLTFGLAAHAVMPRTLRGWGNVLLRTAVASVLSYIAFLITEFIISILNVSILLPFVNAIPWMLSSFIIVICSTQFTRIVYSKRLVIVSVAIGLISMLVWNVFYGKSELDYRVMLLFSFLFYYISMSVSVATAAPRSERYFLKVEGAVKTMDVALYKWLRDEPGKPVTIGKSVDCSLQLSWDVQSDIAPVQAEIRLYRKVPYLIPLRKGVFIRSIQLRPNRRIRLIHGLSFTIGKTTFTYVEKDR